MRKRATITDVAKAAGVTPGTVSRALRSDARVLEATRERVKQAARELGYVPNLSARMFQSGRTGNIGVLCDSGSWMLYNGYFGPLIAGLAEAASEDGHRLLISLPEEGPLPEGGNPDHQLVKLRGAGDLKDGRVDAAVVVGGRSTVREDLEELKATRLPVVLMSNNSLEQGFFQLLSGARERAFHATQALLKSAPGPQGLLGFQEGSSFNQESEAGWRQAHEAEKVPPREALFITPGHAERFHPGSIIAIARHLVKSGARGLLCSEITQSLTVLEAIRRGEIEVGSDFRVAGYGPLPIGATGMPERLLLFDCDLVEAGKRAYALVKLAMQGSPPVAERMNWTRNLIGFPPFKD